MRAALPSLLLLFTVACAAVSDGTKGGLRPAKVSASSAEKAYASRRFAVAIGISDFQDSEWRGLKFAGKDAQDVASGLGAPEKGNFESVTLLTGAEDTTRNRILQALDALDRAASRPDDVVVLYISSHGTLARDHSGQLKRYLVTSDAKVRDVANTALAVETLNARLNAFRSRRRLVVLASCHSGSGKSLLPPDVSRELENTKAAFFARPLEDVSRAAMLLAASDWGETAREDETLQNDIYTHFLLQSLDGTGDRNGDGAVSAYEAHDFARRRTYAFTEGRQRPSAEILEVGADPILLAGRIQRTGRPELYSYAPNLDGFTLKVDGEERAELPGGTSVRPGKRRVELTKGGHSLFDQDISLNDGERLPLEELLRTRTHQRSVYLTAGALGFLDAGSRNQVMPTSPAAGLALRWADAPLKNFDLWVDAQGFGGGREISPVANASVPFRYRLLTVGVGAAYTWRFDRLSLYTGPRVAAVWLGRSFDLAAYSGAQSYFTASPGWMAGLGFALTQRLELSMQGNMLWTYVVTDGTGQSVGFSGAWAGMGYRF